MSQLDGVDCIAAYMHNNIFYPGLGEIKKELSVGATGLNRITKITIDGQFVVVKILGAIAKHMYTIPVPITNFSHLILASEVVTTPPTKE